MLAEKTIHMSIRLLLVFTILFTQFAFSQNNPAPKQPPKKRSNTYGDLNLTMGIPMYNYKETTTSLPFGGTFNILHQPSRHIPILFGGGITYLHAGGQRVNETLTAEITANGIPIQGFEPLVIPLEFRMNNHILNGHAMVRFQAPLRYVKPYIDILGGFNALWTSTAVYDNSPQRYFTTTNDNNLIDRQTQQSAFTWSAGFGAGFYIFLNEDTYLNLNASYLGGGWARYFDKKQVQSWDVQLSVSSPTPGEGSLNADNINVNTIPKNSRTDMLYAQLGLGLNFGGRGSNAANGNKTKTNANPNASKPKPTKPPYRR
jgi:hypothetical protein